MGLLLFRCLLAIVLGFAIDDCLLLFSYFGFVFLCLCLFICVCRLVGWVVFRCLDLFTLRLLAGWLLILVVFVYLLGLFACSCC